MKNGVYGVVTVVVVDDDEDDVVVVVVVGGGGGGAFGVLVQLVFLAVSVLVVVL